MFTLKLPTAALRYLVKTIEIKVLGFFFFHVHVLQLYIFKQGKKPVFHHNLF